ncbi:uncharacterized protein BX663DRAFT_495296, partial [Cokeromyces recurvatus]|uniref:uncharacterized protein n=1 Tax=Cokeromyces recurvatus TaxID=90255 RepID=UPI00221EF8A6
MLFFFSLTKKIYIYIIILMFYYYKEIYLNQFIFVINIPEKFIQKNKKLHVSCLKDIYFLHFTTSTVLFTSNVVRNLLFIDTYY